MDYTKVVMVGNLAANPKFTEGKKETKTDDRAWFRLTVNKYGKTKEPMYFPVIAWGKLARAVINNCKKGKEVLVEGELNAWSTQRPDESWDNRIEVIASRVIFGVDEGYKPEPASTTMSDSEIIKEIAIQMAKEMIASNKAALAAKKANNNK